MIRAAIVSLHPLLGVTGAYGYAGYVDEEELERSVWDREGDSA
jgi:hypothetical protein